MVGGVSDVGLVVLGSHCGDLSGLIWKKTPLCAEDVVYYPTPVASMIGEFRLLTNDSRDAGDQREAVLDVLRLVSEHLQLVGQQIAVLRIDISTR